MRSWTTISKKYMASFAVGLLCLTAVGCQQPHDWWEFRVYPDVQVSLTAATGHEQFYLNRQGPQGPLRLQSGGRQTVLVAARIHDNPMESNDEWSRSFVMVLDDISKPGKTMITPDNGRFIDARALTPPRQPFIGLDGWVRVQPTKNNDEVIAQCSVRNLSSRYGDRGRWLQGTFHFQRTPERSNPIPGVVNDSGPVSPTASP